MDEMVIGYFGCCENLRLGPEFCNHVSINVFQYRRSEV